MLLTTLHWPDEVRSVEELNLPEDQIEIKASEKKMAEQLVASMTGDFNANDYADGYRQALMAVIERKVAGEKPEPQARAEPTNITDLMAALEASVAAARTERKADKAETAAKPAKAARATKAKKATKADAKADEAEAPRQRRRKTA
jgi:DNA end-binding protein Ku